MCFRGRYTPAVVALVLAFAGPATAVEPRVASIETFQESHNPEVSVSGHVVVGLMATSAVEGLQQRRLLVAAASLDEGNSICLKVSSRDGAYLVDGLYAMPAGQSSQVELPFPTENPRLLEGFSVDDIAVTASVGSCRDNERQYLLPHAAGSLPQHYQMAINGFNATDVFYEVKSADGAMTEGECAPVIDGRHTAYDFSCAFSLPLGQPPFGLSVFRELYGRELPTVTLELLHR